ncbi:MAG: 50S ribosomal protein L18 [bacterium]
MDIKKKNNKKEMRGDRVRKRIKGKNDLPRLTVFRSNKFIYAQIIDDIKGIVLCSEIIKSVKNKKEAARETGKNIADKAMAKKIKKVVFDRSNYLYHGRVKELAEGARDGGLEF